MQRVVQLACAKLDACKALDQEPDVVDDLFLLASSVLQHCPGLLIEAAALPQLLACCNSGILIQEKCAPCRPVACNAHWGARHAQPGCEDGLQQGPA